MLIYFNPLSPYRERHAKDWMWTGALSFQSTLSIQRETIIKNCFIITSPISIHSLHTERDDGNLNLDQSIFYFNPLSPYRERLWFGNKRNKRKQFQSTLSIQRETNIKFFKWYCCLISIHSLHTERDRCFCRFLEWGFRFQSTLSIQRET